MAEVKEKNLKQILQKEHADKWVALSADYERVVASGDSLPSLTEQIKGRKDVVIMKVHPAGFGYAP